MIDCATCGKENEEFFKFCLGCGTELASVKEQPPAAPEPEPPAQWPLKHTSPEMEAVSDSMIARALHQEEREEEVESSAKIEFDAFKSSELRFEPDEESIELADVADEPVMLGGLPDPDDIVTVVRPALGAAQTARQCRVCTSAIPMDYAFCAACGAPTTLERDQTADDELEFGQEPAGESRGRVVLLREDGVERAAHDLDAVMTLIGREGCQINFRNDEFLATRHAIFSYRGDRLILRPLDTTNGVYMRLTEEIELKSGDSFRMGQELLLYQAAPELQAAGRAEDEDGTRWLGSTLSPKVWGRLCQRLGPGLSANAFLMKEDDIYLGRDRGQITFPKDGYVSGCHAVVARRDGRVFLKDLGSSNGTYVRLKEEVALNDGDHLLIGQQLLRVEP